LIKRLLFCLLVLSIPATALGGTGHGRVPGVRPVDRARFPGVEITVPGKPAGINNRYCLTDRNPSTKWTGWTDDVSIAWLEFIFVDKQAYTIDSYTLTSSETNPGNDPADWTLKGFSDKLRWETVDERTGERFPERTMTRRFHCRNKAPYRRYRLEFAKTASGSGNLELAEVALLDNATQPRPGPWAGYYVIHNLSAGQVLAAGEEENANSPELSLVPDKGQPPARWSFTKLRDGRYRIRNFASRRVLSLDPENPQKLIQDEWAGRADQKWQLRHTGNGGYRLVSAMGGPPGNQWCPRQIDGLVPTLKGTERMKLHINGNRLVNARGEEILLRGANIPSLEWQVTPDHIDKQYNFAVHRWKSNVIRLPMNSKFWLDTGEKGTNYRKTIIDIVRTAAGDGVYLLTDLHVGFAKGMPGFEDIEYQQDLVAHFRDHPNVLFGLYNEPHPPDDKTWELWHTGNDDVIGHQTLYNAMRAVGGTAIYTISGRNWASQLQGIREGYAINGFHVMYEVHPYPWTSWEYDKHWERLADSYPILFGEWGGWEKDIPYGYKLLAYADEKKFHWAIWAMHPWYTRIFNTLVSGPQRSWEMQYTLAPFGEFLDLVAFGGRKRFDCSYMKAAEYKNTDDTFAPLTTQTDNSEQHMFEQPQKPVYVSAPPETPVNIKGLPGTPDAPETGYGDYDFTVQKEGWTELWVRAKSGARPGLDISYADSFWFDVSGDGEPPAVFDGKMQRTSENDVEWRWYKFYAKSLPPGTYRLRVGYREPDTWWDQFMVTVKDEPYTFPLPDPRTADRTRMKRQRP
jgi:hypothetical protein